MAAPFQKARERRPSDPTNPATPIKVAKRGRAKTLASALYDDDYKNYIKEMCPSDLPGREPWNLEMPANITKAEELSEELIRHAYFYAHYRVTFRKATPRSIVFLQQYRDTAKAAMEKPTQESKIELATLNRILHPEVILYKEPSLIEKEGQEAIKKLVEMRYIADYGDYMAEQCKRFREGATEKKTVASEYFTGFGQNWTTIQETMQKEETNYKDWLARGCLGPYPLQPIVRAVENACDGLGFHITNTRFIIKRYAQRNESMHSKVGHYIQQCDWVPLAGQLWSDLRELPSVFGEEEYEQMKQVLEDVRDRYFDVLDPNEPVPSVRASQLTMALHERLRRRAATTTPQSSSPRSSRRTSSRNSSVISE